MSNGQTKQPVYLEGAKKLVTWYPKLA